MRTLIKIVYIAVIAAECVVFYKLAIVPIIPIVNTVLTDGVSFQVAIDSVQINGIHITSLANLVTRTSIMIIIWSLCMGLTSWLYKILSRLVL